MDEEFETAEPGIEHLRKHVDGLAPDVFEVRVSSQGGFILASTDPEDDNTFSRIQAISSSDLEELNRLGPLVDLVRCLKSPEPSKKRLAYVWHEINLWMWLPQNAHIVRLDRLVVDEIEGRCVGITTAYIPGGTLEENKNRIFKPKWLHQLTAVIDELNLDPGIAHQDVAPRNHLIDDTMDSSMIFDFKFSVRISEVGSSEARSDIITCDVTLRAGWTLHSDVQLEHPVSEFRETLAQWSERRRRGKYITSYKEAPNFIYWPNTPEPPPSEVVLNYSSGPVTQKKVLWNVERRRMLEQGKTALNWQRPPRAKLNSGDRILETGEFIEQT
ncbi:hypothetical protein B0J13DRAFT_580925 [Dactylonectria estremocensis]|uniref:Protein kinase domain-containing protein n=1 Tax=Dactylonectria estremocensis TaxID=1079267 RepID=A0A9P9FEN0_9HYPO|nr:hypothetical protein B0J13DRAFT_580925 [Dactylonectria estremocensis]